MLHWLTLVVLAASVASIPAGLYLARRHNFSLIMVLVIVNFAIFLATYLFNEFFPVQGAEVYDQLMFSPRDMLNLRSSGVMTAYTHMFMHAGFLHIIMNMLFLLIMGMALEDRVGPVNTAAAYLTAGFAAALVTVFAYSLLGNADVHTLGASGAISGVMGAMVALYSRDKVMFPLIIIRPWPVWVIALVYLGLDTLAIAMNMTGTAVAGNTNHFAHLGGFLGGFAWAMVMRGRIERASEAQGTAKPLAGRDAAELKRLASTDELKGILAKIENEDIGEVRSVWIEEFLSKARCPKCSRPLRSAGRSAKCQCGYSITVK